MVNGSYGFTPDTSFPQPQLNVYLMLMELSDVMEIVQYITVTCK